MATMFWELLQQRQSSLTRSGRVVAEYLMQHSDKAQYLSISSLAKECQVAEATVFRFCRALGFDGYHEMRIALAQANVTGSPDSRRAPQPGASTEALCNRANTLFLSAISSTHNVLRAESIDRAAELLRQARQVFCMGLGGSLLVANEISARFGGYSAKFRTAGDSYLQRMTASLMGQGDVVLFISYSGEAQDMLETLQTAKRNGAKVILMTHYEDSPGAVLADVVLLCGASDSPMEPGSFPVKIAELYVAEVLLLRYKLDAPKPAEQTQGQT